MEDLKIDYKSQKEGREWRIKLYFTDGSSRVMFVAVRYWDDWPQLEVLDRAIEFHGIAEHHIGAITMNRYIDGQRVAN